ncbi:MAG: lamin tail domain-containing protein [Balneolaceae bacterium]
MNVIQPFPATADFRVPAFQNRAIRDLRNSAHTRVVTFFRIPALPGLVPVLILTACLYCPFFAEATAQGISLEENFESTGFSPDPVWSGDTGDFIFSLENGRTLLQLHTQPEPNRSQISTPQPAAYGTWEFWFRQDFVPSSVNRSFIFLMADRADLDYLSGSQVNGYAVRTGENGDAKRIRLIRFDNGTQHEILSSRTIPENGTGYRVKVTREPKGKWQIHIREGEEDLPQNNDSVSDDIHTQSVFFGILLRYSASNTDGFFFDDIRVTSEPKPLRADSVVTVSPQTLDVYFTGFVDPGSLNAFKFQLAGGTRPERADLREVPDGTKGAVVRLAYPKPLEGGQDTLTLSGLRNRHGDEADVQRLKILITSPPAPGDLLINEILFDPLEENEEHPSGQSEYIEIHNRKNYAISLEGFHLRDHPDLSANPSILVPAVDKPYWIPGGGFVLVYPEPDGDSHSADFQSGRTAGYFNLSREVGKFSIRFNRSTLSLVQSGRSVVLAGKDGAVIDQADYRPEWHNPNLVHTKGIALERIHPDHPSDDPSNWNSSTHPLGGTPGAENTLFQTPGSGPQNNELTLSPNPFSPDGNGHEDHLFISYLLEEPDYLIRVRIYDRYGRLVRNLAESHPAGLEGSLIWDGQSDSGLVSRIGIYIIQFEAYDSAGGRNRSIRKTAVLATQF